MVVPNSKDPDKCVPMRFYDAVIKRFGPIYGDKIRVEDLVKVEGYRRGRGEDRGGVRKVPPRRRV